MGKSASPAFGFPEAPAVDPNGQGLFVADYGNNLIRRIDVTSGLVTSVGTSASPPFTSPEGCSVDPTGQYLYVSDTGNNLIRSVKLVETVSNVALRFPPAAFSLDLSNSDSAASFTEFPSLSATSLPGVITADGSCEGVTEDKLCLSVVYSEFNAETSTLWLDLLIAASGYHFFQSTSSAASQPASTVVLYSSSSSRRALLAAIKTPLVADATVLFTTEGALSSTVKQGYPPLDIFPNFNALMSGKTLQDTSKVPPSPPGSSARYLLISVALGDDYQAVIYDTFTDSIVSSNKANGAPTHYMLAYSWGACSGNVTRGLVELTFSNDYSNICQLPSTGLYYQSENRYFAIPYSCLGVPYDKLLTDCPEVKANMKSLVDSTCAASIPKVCQQQYETNPPFSCVADIFSSPLTVLSLAISNTLALTGLFSLLAAFLIRRFYSDYKASSEELEALNPTEELGVLVCSFFAAMCGRSALKDNHHASEGKAAVASLEMARYRGENADAESDSSYSWSEIDTNSDDAAGLRARLEKQRALASSSYQPNEASFGLIDSIVRSIIGQRPSPPALFQGGGDEAQPLLEELARTVSSLREEVKELRARQLDTEDVLVKTGGP